MTAPARLDAGGWHRVDPVDVPAEGRVLVRSGT